MWLEITKGAGTKYWLRNELFCFHFFSTNEELQATLQELADLQAQLTELQADNERLTEEKSVLLESLCRQTEKLEDSRTKVDTLQDLLLREGQPDESGTPLPEREQKLVELLKVSLLTCVQQNFNQTC